MNKRTIDALAHAGEIAQALKRGVFLTTKVGEKVNSMVIGWGHLGRIWNLPTYVVYVRESRYTKDALDKTGEFTVSAPLSGIDPKIQQVCGSLSGRDVDKVKEAGLTLEAPEKNHVPGIREYPLTLECRVLYSQKQDPKEIPAEILEKFYPQNCSLPGAVDGRDVHTAYIGLIEDAYIIE